MESDDNMPLFLGIDGGGSTCRARIADANGNVLGEGKAGPANLGLGMQEAISQIKRCTQIALQQAGLANYPLKRLRAGLGLAGLAFVTNERDSLALTQLFASCELTNDAYIACLGAHQGDAGGILILGTGSCAQIISRGMQRTYGGWGFALSDHGSGAGLGREALRIAIQAAESIIPSSLLTEQINSHFAHQANHYLEWSVSAKPADYARFAPLVFSSAAEKDPYALALLRQASEDIANLVRVLASYHTGRIALLGGLAALYPPYLCQEVNDLLSPARGDALAGGLLLARGIRPEKNNDKRLS